uniref:Transthyretin-like family protein n=1 Tax=Bursaphelenchus xylophilus TaxID=6326 RepID=A0A1I7RWA4_BURXY
MAQATTGKLIVRTTVICCLLQPFPQTVTISIVSIYIHARIDGVGMAFLEMKLFVCLTFCWFVAVSSLPHREVQSVAVTGRLICDGKPASSVKVKLYDADTFTLDDLMGETKTDSDGRLLVRGHAKEFTNIDPKVNVYHHCGDTGKITQKCTKKFSIQIPKSYITHGKERADKIFDIGTLNLNGKLSGEGRDCLN